MAFLAPLLGAAGGTAAGAGASAAGASAAGAGAAGLGAAGAGLGATGAASAAGAGSSASGAGNGMLQNKLQKKGDDGPVMFIPGLSGGARGSSPHAVSRQPSNINQMLEMLQGMAGPSASPQRRRMF